MAICQYWLAEAARESLGDFELTADLDAELSARAILARTDSMARDALFMSLSGKIVRFAERFRRWNLAPWTYDDVMQETFLVFAETLRAWRPIAGRQHPRGFGRYFLRVFPLWLTTRIRKMIGSRPGRVLVASLAVTDNRPDPLIFEPQIDTLVVLDTLREHLSVRDGRIVYLRVVADAAPAEVAIRIQASERTVRRRLARIAPVARSCLAG